MSTRSAELRAQAKFERDLSSALIEETNKNALRLAPAFRDKFDFSEPKHFEAWADLAWQAADAMLQRKLKAIALANKELEKANDAADRQQLKERPEAST